MTSVDWGALHDAASTIGDIPQAGQQGALAGYQLGQMGAVRGALQGVNYADPNSVKQAIGSLVQAGAFDQANTLSGLKASVEKNTYAGQRWADLTRQTQGGGAPSAAPATAPAIAPATAQTASGENFAANAQAVLDAAKGSIARIGEAPPEQKASVAAAERQSMLNMGLPQDRVDALYQHMAGDGFSSGSVSEASDYIDAMKAHPAVSGSGDASTPYPLHPAEVDASGGSVAPVTVTASRPATPKNWAYDLAMDPNRVLGNEMDRVAGVPAYSDQMIDTLAGPEVREQAEVANARAKAFNAKTGSNEAELATPTGTETYYTKAPGGKLERQDMTPQEALDFQADPNNYITKQLPADVQAYQERMGGLTAEAKLGGAVEAARKAGENTGTLEDIPVTNPDGSQSTTKMTVADYIHGARTGTLPAGVGVTQSNTQKAFTDADSANLAKVQALAADESRTGKIQSEIDNANRALATLKGINTNAGTGAYKALVDGLNAAGIPFAAKDANNLTLYQSSLNQMVADNGRAFPGRFTDKDLGLTKGVMAQLTSPRDAAAVLIATKAATTNREKSYLDGIRSYNGYSQRDYDNGFAQSTPGSLFADPAFQNVTVNGRPFVQIGTQPHTDGHVYGVIMPGTKQAQTFLVK